MVCIECLVDACEDKMIEAVVAEAASEVDGEEEIML